VRTWQQVAGRRLLTTLGLTEGLVYVTSTQQVMPSIVAVDEAGSAAAIKEHQPRTALDPLVITAQLKHSLAEIRTFSTDDALVRRQMHAASQYCLAPAQQFRTRSSTENTLPATLKRRRVFPVHIVISPRSPKSGQARWKEQLVRPDGTVAEETAWEATLEITLLQPQSQEERQRRPRGRWIASLYGAHL
jgi:type IV secretory pathway TrbF-like protein